MGKGLTGFKVFFVPARTRGKLVASQYRFGKHLKVPLHKGKNLPQQIEAEIYINGGFLR